jgi:hypothetical protein
MSTCILVARRAKLSRLESIYACGAALALQCTIVDTSFPARVLWVSATNPPNLVIVAQCQITRHFGNFFKSHSSARSGLPTDTIGWRVVLLFSLPQTGQPELWVDLSMQVALYGGWPSRHSHSYILRLLLATCLAGGLL